VHVEGGIGATGGAVDEDAVLGVEPGDRLW